MGPLSYRFRIGNGHFLSITPPCVELCYHHTYPKEGALLSVCGEMKVLKKEKGETYYMYTSSKCTQTLSDAIVNVT